MRILDEARVDGVLAWPDLIETLREAFRAGRIEAPPRQTLTVELPEGRQAWLLLMPAWEAGRAIGVKVATFFPDNAAQAKATINAGYLLFDGADGRMTAVLDGHALTARRTAAASALAADYLARPDVEILLVVGTGQLAGKVAQAHATVRNYRQVLIWGRSPAKAVAVADRLSGLGLDAQSVEDLEAACRRADVISTVTTSTAPLVRGDWLRAGTHLDLIGAFKPDMRESDDQAVAQATLFVDERAGALLAGDLAQPLAAGVISETDLAADLADLVRATHPGRRGRDERTLFKSVGLASEDLAAAVMATV